MRRDSLENLKDSEVASMKRIVKNTENEAEELEKEIKKLENSLRQNKINYNKDKLNESLKLVEDAKFASHKALNRLSEVEGR